MIETGSEAPDFTLTDQHGEQWTLSDLRGQPVVVYFYPKASTPGCTTQACGVRDHSADYEAAGAVVLGISPDPIEAIRAFDEEHGLGFPLLSDLDHAVAEAYGAWGEKQMYGRTYLGVIRSTFVVGPDGRVAHVIPKVNPRKHDEQVLAALGALAAA